MTTLRALCWTLARIRVCCEWLFGCPHRRETRPMRRRNSRGQIHRGRPSYVVCIECGRERDYTLLDVPQREPVSVSLVVSLSADTSSATLALDRVRGYFRRPS